MVFLYNFFAILLIITSFRVDLGSVERGSSAPFISGDTFRANANHILDDTTPKFYPERVKSGDIIFVKTDGEYLQLFFNHYHPKIKFPYILLTHNSDHGAPGSFRSYLDDPKVLAWFAQNVEGSPHPKLHPIPIGIANKCWEHGNPHIFAHSLPLSQNSDRPFLCYLNFQCSTYPKERLYVWNLFAREPWCVVSHPKPMAEYLKDLSRSKFVFNPRGNGPDCHRAWEALLMGAIPIIRTSALDPLFLDLPVLIIENWEIITESYLNEQYEIIKQKNYDLEKLFIEYWIKKIHSIRDKALSLIQK